MHKFIDADKLIDIYGAHPAGTMITLGNLIDAINSLPAEEVIPISFIKDWLAAHAHGSTRWLHSITTGS